MSPNALKASQDPVIGGAVRPFVNTPFGGSDIADLIVQARKANLPHEAMEIASAFDLSRTRGEETTK